MVKLFITMLDIRKLGEVLFTKRKKQVFRASLTFIALSFLLIGSFYLIIKKIIFIDLKVKQLIHVLSLRDTLKLTLLRALL